jgi:hypothetical protein
MLFNIVPVVLLNVIYEYTEDGFGRGRRSGVAHRSSGLRLHFS